MINQLSNKLKIIILSCIGNQLQLNKESYY
jgi:hypothetical protein